jgi:hypothetical protein
MLLDGTYDVIVVDARAADGDDDGLQLDVTILAGAHKGDVVSLRAVGLGLDELAVLGSPGTLAIAAGEPSLTLE